MSSHEFTRRHAAAEHPRGFSRGSLRVLHQRQTGGSANKALVWPCLPRRGREIALALHGEYEHVADGRDEPPCHHLDKLIGWDILMAFKTALHFN